MRRHTTVVVLFLMMVLFAGCTLGSFERGKLAGKIVVGASPSPHAEILQQAVPILREKGIELKIKEFSDYVLPNIALQDKELDANYFQHFPYLQQYNEQKGASLVSAGAIHYEPLCLYGGRIHSLDHIVENSIIAIPNDATNESRALVLLKDLGLIGLSNEVKIGATVRDITENPKNLRVQEIDAAQLVRSLKDVDLAVITGNFALQGGLSIDDALAKEEADSSAARTYANIIAVHPEDQSRDEILALIDVLKSEQIKDFIRERYHGSVEVVS